MTEMKVVYMHTEREGGIERERQIAVTTGNLGAVQVPRVGDHLSIIGDEANAITGDVTRVHWVLSENDQRVIVRYG